MFCSCWEARMGNLYGADAALLYVEVVVGGSVGSVCGVVEFECRKQ